MAEARGFRNRSSCRVDNKLKAIKLTARKIEKERVIVVHLWMNEQWNSPECSGFDEGHEWIENMIWHGWDMFWESKWWVKNNAKITCGVCGRYSDNGGHKKNRIRKFGKLLRKTNEQEFSFRLIERQEVCWHSSWDIMSLCYESSVTVICTLLKSSLRLTDADTAPLYPLYPLYPRLHIRIDQK